LTGEKLVLCPPLGAGTRQVNLFADGRRREDN
jgi:hypothetical protein